jgi:hypothetical protein
VADRRTRGEPTPDGEVTTDEERVTEDTLGGLPRSNYHTGDFASDIQAMPQSEVGRILDQFPYTKRGPSA